MEMTKIESLTLAVQLLEKQHSKYKSAYHLLMQYFDSIADEEREYVSKELERIGL